VRNIQETLQEIFLQPVHYPFRSLVNAGMFNYLKDSLLTKPDEQVDSALLAEVEQKSKVLIHEVQKLLGVNEEGIKLEKFALNIRRNIESILKLPVYLPDHPEVLSSETYNLITRPISNQKDQLYFWGVLFGWAFTHALGSILNGEDQAERSRSWIDEWLLGKIIATTLQDFGLGEEEAWRAVATTKWLTTHQNWMELDSDDDNRAGDILMSLLGDGEVQNYLSINRYRDILWFNKEAFGQLLDWLMVLATISALSNPDLKEHQISQQLSSDHEVLKTLESAEAESGYQVEKLIERTLSKT
jgi:hypothetical protein